MALHANLFDMEGWYACNWMNLVSIHTMICYNRNGRQMHEGQCVSLMTAWTLHLLCFGRLQLKNASPDIQ